mmetsp:Transcript_30687/g.73548  ORF Transcript_30687/g.73548 Transcript_30687/m.73548 type:complete len:266 (-) Transcript_30687:258-1055(-)
MHMWASTRIPASLLATRDCPVGGGVALWAHSRPPPRVRAGATPGLDDLSSRPQGQNNSVLPFRRRRGARRPQCRHGSRNAAQCRGLSASLGLRLLRGVARPVELCEEHDERHVHNMGNPSRNKPVLCSAPSGVKLVQENTDIGESCQELEDLGTCQILLPPHLLAQSGDQVVVVHEGVNDGVDNHAPQRPLQPAELAPTPGDPQHAHMVIHMQWDRWLALQHQQDRVTELVILGQVVDLDPEPSCAIQNMLSTALTAEDSIKALL